MSPFLVPCLVKLRDQFNHEFPTRDKASDGWIADEHHDPSSDHQPNAQGAVRAVDVDVDLKRPGIDMSDALDLIIVRHQLGDDDRAEFIIFDRLIYSRKRGYKPVKYTGTSDPHTRHAHISARHDGTGWSDTTPWGLETLMTKQELRDVVDDALIDFFLRKSQGEENDNTATSRIGRDALDQGVPNPIRGGKTPAWQLLGDIATAVKPGGD